MGIRRGKKKVETDLVTIGNETIGGLLKKNGRTHLGYTIRFL